MPENPFLLMLGAHIVDWKEGECIWELEILPHHLNSQGSLHGGVIATLLDVACGYSGYLPDLDGCEARAATLSLTVHYMAKATQGTLKAKGRRKGGGMKTFFAEAELYNSEDNSIVASATGCFRLHGNIIDK